MEDGFMKAIYAITAATGQKPARIEMPGGTFMLKFHGVDFLLTASQYGYLWLKLHPQMVPKEKNAN